MRFELEFIMFRKKWLSESDYMGDYMRMYLTRNWIDSVHGRNYWKALVNATLNFLFS